MGDRRQKKESKGIKRPIIWSTGHPNGPPKQPRIAWTVQGHLTPRRVSSCHIRRVSGEINLHYASPSIQPILPISRYAHLARSQADRRGGKDQKRCIYPRQRQVYKVGDAITLQTDQKNTKRQVAGKSITSFNCPIKRSDGRLDIAHTPN